MTARNPLVNPLFASSSPAAPAGASTTHRCAQTTVKIGAYGGVVVASWLVAALATGYGVAAADSTGSTSTRHSSHHASSASTGHRAHKPDTRKPTTRDPGGRRHTTRHDKPRHSEMTAPTAATGAASADGSRVKRDLQSSRHRSLRDSRRPAFSRSTSKPSRTTQQRSPRSVFDAKPVTLPTTTGAAEIAETVKRSLVKATVADKRVRPRTASAVRRVQTLVDANTEVNTDPSRHPVAVVAPKTQPPARNFVGVFNGIVSNLLSPLTSTAPDTPEPANPVVWAVLGWVRRNLFNQAPTMTSNPVTTVQTGQTVTGSIGAVDAEGDALTYTVTTGPKYGTVTIDQQTGEFTYTPNDIDYDAAQEDSFAVSVTDGHRINLLSLFSPRTAHKDLDVTVLSPQVERVILDLPDDVTHPNTPRFSQDGTSIYFGATPADGGRQEIYQIGVEDHAVTCITCGVSTGITAGLGRVVPFQDDSGRLMIQVTTSPNSYVVYEETDEGKVLVPVVTPPSGATVLDPQREMRISPDGTHVLFSQIQMSPAGMITAVPVVGTLERTDAGYEIADARVVYPVGEGKQWTPDGKGVIVLGGRYEAGNVDDIVVDLATGDVTRLTGNLDYDEDTDLSPNQQWIAIGSTRGYDALTPMSRIVRPAFLPADIQGAVYQGYAGASDGENISNQEWVLAIDDELKGENGIPLFVDGDGYTARSMASWNSTGDAVAFWEASPSGESQLVIAHLNYTTSVGPVADDRTTPDPTWAPELSGYVPAAAPLPEVGTYKGARGGTAVVDEVTDATGHTVRTVTYTDYVNDQGMILNGTEWTDTTASQSSIRYVADIDVTGEHTGYLDADATINKLTRSISGHITSELDGDVQSVLDKDRIDEGRADI